MMSFVLFDLTVLVAIVFVELFFFQIFQEQRLF